MTHAPRIPKEQRSFANRGGKSLEEAQMDRRDLQTGAQSGQPGDADVNLDTQGRYGNLRQNMTTQWKTQER
ncbi:hypothetical protein GCM10009422_01660 [Brevundimonas kwangchunensis]|uniref:Uncharacterized protein n=1 Tax=Brevundimonas kwangchunensis TaxID=322163 RepID=A0ABP3RMD0_9CAUL